MYCPFCGSKSIRYDETEEIGFYSCMECDKLWGKTQRAYSLRYRLEELIREE